MENRYPMEEQLKTIQQKSHTAIIKQDGAIDMGELSRQNGLSEFENIKTIAQLLAIKADVTGKTQTLHFRYTEKA